MPQPSTLFAASTASAGQLRLIRLTSLDELRAHAAAWDDLWRRSDVTLPLARAELVAQLVERFAPGARFQALVVEQQGFWLAALPLIEDSMIRSPRLIAVGRTPYRGYPGGQLLLDPSCDVERVLDCLVAGVSGIPWGVVWLDDFLLDSTAAVALNRAIVRAGLLCTVEERYGSAWLDIDHDWNAFTQRLSGTFRRQNARLTRRLAERGEIRFESRRSFDAASVEAWLRRGFEVEDRNWKGRDGTSVLGLGQFSFFLRQAQELARAGELQLTLLESAGRGIAFVFGVTAKGVHHSCRIGYDEAYAKYNPGHLLYYRLFEELWSDRGFRAQDFWGEWTEAQSHWRPIAQRVGRMVVATGGLLSRAAVRARYACAARLRRLRQYRSLPLESDPPGAATPNVSADPRVPFRQTEEGAAPCLQ